MKTHDIGKGKHGLTGGFATMAITQPDKKQDKTDMSIPSASNVKQAKDWVDHNKK